MSNYSRSIQHRLLLLKYGDWFHEVIKSILAIAPETEQIWCHGLAALNPTIRGGRREWDFIAFLPHDTHNSRIAFLNDFNSPLDQLQDVTGTSVEVQASRHNDNTVFNKVVTSEGFPIWREGQQVYAQEFLKIA